MSPAITDAHTGTDSTFIPVSPDIPNNDMTRRTAPAMLDFLSPLSLVPGMGPKRIAALQESEVVTIGDLLYRFPRRYLDRSEIIPISQLSSFEGEKVTIRGTIDKISMERGRRPRLRVLLADTTGTIELLWFQGVSWLRKSLRKQQRCLVTGTISRFTRLQIVHPLLETLTEKKEQGVPPIIPLYRLTESMREAGMGQRFLQKTVLWILKNLKHYPQILPEPIARNHPFPPLDECIRELHFPTDITAIEPYRDRIRFEELYQLALTLRLNRSKLLQPGRSYAAGTLVERFRKTLTFILTEEQEKAVEVLLGDCAAPQRMHRLLQGDVGSGKTVVAFLAALPALNSGYQVVWMTPTELLARQTFEKLTQWLIPFGYTTELLTAAKNAGNSELIFIRQRIASGKAAVVVGTHALLQPSVHFNNVGIFVIDEQHRFGARQRLSLSEKDSGADLLVMSATPIPRTLAQTLYNDLDVVTISSLPPGRQPVATHLVPESKRFEMEHFIKSRLRQGEQAYYIVPRIEESENENAPPVQSLEKTFTALTSGTFHDCSASFIHGKLDTKTKTARLGAFSRGTTALLVATSVVEVGIDVPDATIIVIENSERFGLAQLHQLRGRVGRGAKKSYCFLLTIAPAGSDTALRLKSFCSQHDGFAVAEMDLRNRGPGEVTGFKQSGWENLIVADILHDADLFSQIIKEIDEQLFKYFAK